METAHERDSTGFEWSFGGAGPAAGAARRLADVAVFRPGAVLAGPGAAEPEAIASAVLGHHRAFGRGDAAPGRDRATAGKSHHPGSPRRCARASGLAPRHCGPDMAG